MALGVRRTCITEFGVTLFPHRVFNEDNGVV